MKKKLKWTIRIIFILLIIYLISYFKYGFVERKTTIDKNSYVFTYFLRSDKFNYRFGHVYKSTENEIITPKKIFIKKTNLLNFSEVIYKNNNPQVTEREYFFIIPFWIKKLEVNSQLEIDNKIVEINHIFYPYFEYGIYSFWLLAIPFMWEFIREIPLIEY